MQTFCMVSFIQQWEIHNICVSDRVLIVDCQIFKAIIMFQAKNFVVVPHSPLVWYLSLDLTAFYRLIFSKRVWFIIILWCFSLFFHHLLMFSLVFRFPLVAPYKTLLPELLRLIHFGDFKITLNPSESCVTKWFYGPSWANCLAIVRAMRHRVSLTPLIGPFKAEASVLSWPLTCLASKLAAVKVMRI